MSIRYLKFETDDRDSGKIPVDEYGVLINHIGGVQADWSVNDPSDPAYVKNRICYTADPVETTLIEEQTVTFDNVSELYAPLEGSLCLEEGKTYIVNFNGGTYECVAWHNSELDAMCIGNGALIGDSEHGNNEPFCCDSGAMGEIFLGTSVTGVYTISISAFVSESTQIDSKYLPNSNIVNGSSKFSLRTTGSMEENENYKMGRFSFACGFRTTASGENSHAEGTYTIASGLGSHAEGRITTASGSNSHAEGIDTTASGENSHSEGNKTTASGIDSHAEGNKTTASGFGSHAEGIGTIATGKNQHVQGRYNIEDSAEKYANIVGNGKSDTARSNAHTLDWSGNAWFAGTVEGMALIVKSSTAGSSKRFKITVDDSGTISATEVT